MSNLLERNIQNKNDIKAVMTCIYSDIYIYVYIIYIYILEMEDKQNSFKHILSKKSTHNLMYEKKKNVILRD